MSLYTTPMKGIKGPATTPTLFDSGISIQSSTMESMDIDSGLVGTRIAPAETQWQHLYILPVLLLEFLALALTRAVLPSLLLQRYDTNVYIVMGCAECVRGLLAFISCPLFGKLSDIVGRKLCLLVTVAGTCAPVCSLALLPWDSSIIVESNNATEAVALAEDESAFFSPMLETHYHATLKPHAITAFVILLSLSGIFSSTFTIVFAYISDTVLKRDERVSAYGLAMATLGLSFTIGPMLGGYLAQYNTRYVFCCSLILTILDLIYIYAILPESKPNMPTTTRSAAMSIMSMDLANQVSWNPWDTMRIIAVDPLLRLVGQVAFLYYTSLWAVVSTLVLYAAKRFALGPERLGELMSALGLSTMVAEAVLVRILVPLLGEKKSMRVGLAAFAMQCILLGLSFEPWHLFVCIIFSMVGNLVYPSLTSLVSSSVEPESIGEALGAVNGIKAVTEGVGPLVFGSLMTLSEKSALPGWPYLLAAVLVYVAYEYAGRLPDVEKDEYYVHELERKQRRGGKDRGGLLLDTDESEEYEGLLEPDSNNLLSEIDEEDDDTDDESRGLSRLPRTFVSMFRSPDRCLN